MNRYFLFVGHPYYPLGGALDFHSSYPSLKTARDAVKGLKIEMPYDKGRALLATLVEKHDAWWHIMNGETGNVVCESKLPKPQPMKKGRLPKAAILQEALDQRAAMIARYKKAERAERHEAKQRKANGSA